MTNWMNLEQWADLHGESIDVQREEWERDYNWCRVCREWMLKDSLIEGNCPDCENQINL